VLTLLAALAMLCLPSLFFPNPMTGLAVAEGEQTGQTPVIHSILLEGKDSGRFHAHPLDRVNISALVSHATWVKAGIWTNGQEVVAALEMTGEDRTYYLDLEVPGVLDDLTEYQVKVTATNDNGSKERHCGRILRVNHLYVEATLLPGVVVEGYELVITARTWQHAGVSSGESMVNLVSYSSPEEFTTSTLGKRYVDGRSTFNYTVSATFDNLTFLKFDIDVIDTEREHLGRTSTYGFGVPFAIDIACRKELEVVRGNRVCGPIQPTGELNYTIEAPHDLPNATLEFYRIDQVQELAIDEAEPLTSKEVELEAGNTTGPIQVPNTAGSYILVVRGVLNGTASMGYCLVQVQSVNITITAPASAERGELITIEVEPEPSGTDLGVSITIGNDRGTLLVVDGPAIPEGDSFTISLEIPYFAVNDTYYVAAYYHGGTYDVKAMAIAYLLVNGGPLMKPETEPPPPSGEDDDDRPSLMLPLGLLGLILSVGLLGLLRRRPKPGPRGSITAHESGGGGAQELEEESADRDDTDADGQQQEPA